MATAVADLARGLQDFVRHSRLQCTHTECHQLKEWNPQADAKQLQIVLENDKVRVVDMHLNPGEKGPMHLHANFVVIQLSEFKAQSIDKDGGVEEVNGRLGKVIWEDEVEHFERNVGNTRQHAIIVELNKAITEIGPGHHRGMKFEDIWATKE